MLKTCFKCKRELPRSEFYAHPQMGDGLLGKCKDCTKADAIANYDRRRQDPAFVARERARGRDKHARLYSTGAGWQSPDAPLEMKKRAWVVLNRAVQSGQVVRPTTCSDCGDAGRIDGHHRDYAKPLDVDWLCQKCHRRRHAVHPERLQVSA